MIQQRSLCLTAPDVIQFHIDRNARLRSIAQEKLAAANRKAANKAAPAHLPAVRLAARENSTKDGNAMLLLTLAGAAILHMARGTSLPALHVVIVSSVPLSLLFVDRVSA